MLACLSNCEFSVNRSCMKELCITLLISFYLPLIPANAKIIRKQNLNEEIAIRCIAGEARGESFRGMVAVAEVLRRRGSTRGVVGCKSNFKSSKPIREKARKAWRRSRTTNYSRGADHFDGSAFPRPKWSFKMKKVCVIGKQIFWKA